MCTPFQAVVVLDIMSTYNHMNAILHAYASDAVASIFHDTVDLANSHSHGTLNCCVSVGCVVVLSVVGAVECIDDEQQQPTLLLAAPCNNAPSVLHVCCISHSIIYLGMSLLMPSVTTGGCDSSI